MSVINTERTPAAAAGPSPKDSSVASRGPIGPASIVLRGTPVSLDTEVGREFIGECCRNIEGLLPESEIKRKWELGDNGWSELATNKPLLEAVRRERDRRIRNGSAIKEAAQLQLAKAPGVLGDILNNGTVSPRHRIEAAKELRQTVGDDRNLTADAGERFVITINLGGNEKLVYDKSVAPIEPKGIGEGELP